MTIAIVVLTFIVLLVKMQGYLGRYTATTTKVYREHYGVNTYEHKMSKLALMVYIIASVVAGVTLFGLIAF